MARNELQKNATLTPGVLPEGMSSAQGLAMAALLLGKTITAAAQAAGVNRTTVWRWMREDPDFSAFYASARREMAASVEQSVRMLSSTAVATLRRLLTRRTVPDAVKLQAALAVLRISVAPVEGPVDAEDAKNTILRQAKKLKQESMVARIGMSGSSIMDRLDGPIDRLGRGETAGLDEHEADPDLDESEFEEEEDIDEDELDAAELDDE